MSNDVDQTASMQKLICTFVVLISVEPVLSCPCLFPNVCTKNVGFN